MKLAAPVEAGAAFPHETAGNWFTVPRVPRGEDQEVGSWSGFSAPSGRRAGTGDLVEAVLAAGSSATHTETLNSVTAKLPKKARTAAMKKVSNDMG